MTLLLKNCVLPDGAKRDLAIENGFIKVIKASIPRRPDWQVIDAKDRLVSPGFVDCHLHLDKTLIAVETPNRSGTLEEAIRVTAERKKMFTRQEVKSRARRTLEMAISKGTVCIRTNVDIDPIVGLVGLEALLELREEYKDRIEMQLVAFPQEGIDSSPGTLELMTEALEMGADAVGGIPLKDKDPSLHIREVFDLAERFAVPLDLHIDESDDPSDLTILNVARKAIERELIGQITAAHCCSLAALSPERLKEVLEVLEKAQLNIVALPSTNLYLQGRNDAYRTRRGIAPVKRLLESGLLVAFGSDNVRDAFNPFGNADLLETSLLAAHACHMGGEEELNQVFDMVTTNPAKIMGVENEIALGSKARLVILDARSKAQAIVEQAPVVERIFEGHPTFSMLQIAPD